MALSPRSAVFASTGFGFSVSLHQELRKGFDSPTMCCEALTSSINGDGTY